MFNFDGLWESLGGEGGYEDEIILNYTAAMMFETRLFFGECTGPLKP